MDITLREEPATDHHLVFAGDYVVSSYYDPVLVDSPLRQLIEAADASFVNLEAPVDTETPQMKHGPILDQKRADVHRLSTVGFDCITLANNHIMDHGKAGLSATTEACVEADIRTVGAGIDVSEALEPIIITAGDAEIAVFNACEKEFGIADERSAGALWIDERSLKQRVREADREYDLVILVAHGGIEFVPLPPPSWRSKLYQFAESGVDAVVAHHPHVSLPWEFHDGVPIVYSLGNFAFYNERRPETQWAYTLEMELTGTEISTIGIRPVESVDGVVRLMNSPELIEKWEYLNDLSKLFAVAQSEPGYWQEIALQVFEERYSDRLEDFGDGFLLSMLRNPILEFDRITRNMVTDKKRRRTQELALLNYTQSDCHRDVIETALGLKTNTIGDRRTTEIQNEIDQFLHYTNSRYEWGKTDFAKWYLKKGLKRVSNSRS